MIAFFRQLLFYDFWLKLFSLTLAVLIWFAVGFTLKDKRRLPSAGVLANPIVERTFTRMPILVVSTAEDVHDFRVQPGEVQVTVQGEKRLLQRIEPGDVRVIVDLTDVRGTQNLRRRVEVSTPPGISYVEVRPEEVQILFPNAK